MSETVQVVRILHENPDYAGEFVEINASDYDPAKHQLYEDGASPAPTPKPRKERK